MVARDADEDCNEFIEVFMSLMMNAFPYRKSSRIKEKILSALELQRGY